MREFICIAAAFAALLVLTLIIIRKSGAGGDGHGNV